MEAGQFEVLSTLEERVSPRHTALLVIDMQNDYCSPGGAADRNGYDLSLSRQTIPIVGRLIETARAKGIPIIFTKFTVGPGSSGLSGFEVFRRGTIFSGTPTVRGTWGHDIISELPYCADQDLVVEKRRPSSFLGTDLDLCLRAGGVRTLVVTGLATEGCVSATVIDAAGRDYYVAVVRDGVSSVNPRGHQIGLEFMETHVRYVDGIVTSSRLCAIWEGDAI